MAVPRFRGTSNAQTQVSAGRRNTHSPPIRRYLLTMVCAMTGALGALWVANMESNSIKKASDETHMKRTGNSTDATGRRRQFRPLKLHKDTPEEENEKSKHGMEADKDHKAGIHGINIALLGERNTGTRWTFSELQKCFPEHVVKPRLIRWKHWFQEDDGKDHAPTIVVAQFRNPYEWVEAMRLVPHHAPEHMFLEWEEFVTKPWTIDRPKRDIDFREQGGDKCYEGFSYNELISCVEGDRKDEEHIERLKVNPKEGYFSGHKPIYELNVDKSGTPYDNILKFRAAKIKNFLDVEKWKWVIKVFPVQYENLLSRGNGWLIKELESALNFKTDCTPSPPQFDRRRRNVTEGYVDYITENIDWDIEKLIDYGKAGGPGGFLLDSQVIIENKEEEEDLEPDDEDGDEKRSENKEKVIKLVDDDNNSDEDEDDNISDEDEDEDNNPDEDKDHDENSDEEDNVNDDSSSLKNEISNDMNDAKDDEDDEAEENNEEPDNLSNDTNNKESESNNEDEEDNDSVNEDNEGEENEEEKSYKSKSRNDDDGSSAKAKDDDESVNEDEEEEKVVKKSHSSESRRKDDEEDNEKHESKTDSEDYKEDKYTHENKEEEKKDSKESHKSESSDHKEPIIHEKNDSSHDEKDDEKSSGKKIIDLGTKDEGEKKKSSSSSSSSNKKDEKSDEKIIDLGVEEK